MGVTDGYLARLRTAVKSAQPALLPLFETMAAEATFAREWLAADLAALPSGASILEVGGGTFILSCLLAEEGFAVTSIEPVGDGFGEFPALAQIVLDTAFAKPAIARVRGEDFISETQFDFAFSVNVMEHVDDPQTVISRVMAALTPGAHYRFFCPNYLFPYEPHFNMPTLWSKEITQFVFHERIRRHPMSDPIGTWGSLNWITVPKVKHIVHRLGLVARFDTAIFSQQLERVRHDAGFATRRGKYLSRTIRHFTGLGLHRTLNLLPASCLPTMDVTLKKRSA